MCPLTACFVGRTWSCCGSICEETDKPVIASGGISTLEDIIALRDMVGSGVEGAIIGTALYVGRFTIEEALRAAQLSSTTGSKSA